MHDGGGGGGGGGAGSPTELHIANPKKYTSLKFYTPKNSWHLNFLSKKIRLKYLNTDLFYQTDFENQKKITQQISWPKQLPRVYWFFKT